MNTNKIINTIMVCKKILDTDGKINTPKNIYSSTDLEMNYNTFYRIFLELKEKKLITAQKLSHGRGKGADWTILRINKTKIKEAIKKLYAQLSI